MIFTKCIILLTIIIMILMQKKNMESYDLYYMYDSSDCDFSDPNTK